jgi:hypothetical protein
MRLNLPREFYIPKGSTKVADKQSDAVAYVRSFPGRGRDGQPVERYEAAIFFGNQAKPVAHYTYRSEAERERSVREHFERRRGHATYVREQADKRKAFAHTVKVGDIFTASWGYDQTNVDAYQVTEVRGKHAILRKICLAAEGGGPGGEVVVPQTDSFVEGERGEPMRRLIQEGGIKIDEVRWATPWGKRDPITGTVIGRAMHQTAFGWGH